MRSNSAKKQGVPKKDIFCQKYKLHCSRNWDFNEMEYEGKKIVWHSAL